MIRPKKLFIFRPTVGQGGADRISITLVKNLDRNIFHPTLILVKRDGDLLDQIDRDTPVIELGMRRLRYSWHALARLLRLERPDVLLSTSSGGNLVASLAHRLSPQPGRRLILSQRNTFSIVRRDNRSDWLPVTTVTRILYRQADRIIAVSKGVADDLVESLSLPKDLVVPIHNPVVSEELLEQSEGPVDDPWLQEEIPVVLAVGRLVPQKDYPTLLRAFARVRRELPVRLIVLGEGESRSELGALVESLGIKEDVRFAGYVKNPFPYMRLCTLYVLSSKFEGLPGSLIQAMACGAPVISTDCPSGPAEIIESGKNGVLVKVGDVEGLTEAMLRVLVDPGFRSALSDAARRASEAFEVTSQVKQYEDVLLGRGPNGVNSAAHQAQTTA